MKVNVSPEKTVPLKEIKIGDCFVSNLSICMRIYDHTNIGTDIGVVNLKTGEVAWWDKSTEVRPVACEVNERKD